MKKTLIILICLAAASVRTFAQEERVKPDPDAKLIQLVASDPHLSIDTTYVRTFRNINNYSMFGVQYGINLTATNFSPTRQGSMMVLPVEVGVMYTRYCKLFGYMPYFGFQIGAFYSQQGYSFANDTAGHPVYNILGAYRASMKTVEIPANAQFHVDFWKMKIIADIGFFGGYRLAVDRQYEQDRVFPEEIMAYKNTFHPNEKRFYYGFQGGAGLALVFDPIEIHIMAMYKYNLSSMHKPNVYLPTLEENANLSNYYYAWTNLNSVGVSVGIHYQLSRRIGKTRREIREEARREALEMRRNELSEKNSD